MKGFLCQGFPFLLYYLTFYFAQDEPPRGIPFFQAILTTPSVSGKYISFWVPSIETFEWVYSCVALISVA